jgi:hypothetical protein
MMPNFEVTYDIFNVYKICTLIASSSQKWNKNNNKGVTDTSNYVALFLISFSYFQFPIFLFGHYVFLAVYILFKY